MKQRSKLGIVFALLVIVVAVFLWLRSCGNKPKPKPQPIVTVASPQPTPQPSIEDAPIVEPQPVVKSRPKAKALAQQLPSPLPSPTIPPPVRPELEQWGRMAYAGDRLPLPNGEFTVPSGMLIVIAVHPSVVPDSAPCILTTKRIDYPDGTYRLVPGDPPTWNDVIEWVRQEQRLPPLPSGCLLSIPQLDGTVHQWFFSSCHTAGCEDEKLHYR